MRTKSLDIAFFTRQSLAQTSRIDPNVGAIGLEDDEPLTYSQLASAVRRYANSLINLGVEPRRRVGLLMSNSVQYWIAYFSITRIGAIAVRLNFRLSREELRFAIKDSGISVLLADPDLLEPIEPIRDELGVETYLAFGPAPPWTLDWNILERGNDNEPDIALPTADSPAMIMYTSGTTGHPKGALWTHSSTTWWTAMQLMEWNFTSSSVTMVTGPLYHIGALENYSLPTLAAGGRVVLLRSKGFNIDRTLQIASNQGVTDLLLFPSMIYQMLQSRRALKDIDLGRLSRIFTGGDSLLPSASNELLRRYPWIDLIQVYGLTEGTPVAACGSPGFARVHPESVGRPFPFCEVSIRDDDGRSVESGVSGEIWTRSPANAAGYWENPEASAATFVNGWCKTGDIGVIEDGFLRIAGRKKDMIRSGGENIYPAEIEDVLLRHSKIADAAVIGIPDATYIEAVCAIVVPTEGAAITEAEVIEHCGEYLAGYKKPKRVIFVPEIPRTPSQKIMKYRLREMYG